MIRASYDGDRTVEVRGHAGAGPKGRDLICAGVSALVLTLWENSRSGEIRPGYARILGRDPAVTAGIFRGLSLLARRWPAYVRCEETGDGNLHRESDRLGASEERKGNYGGKNDESEG